MYIARNSSLLDSFLKEYAKQLGETHNISIYTRNVSDVSSKYSSKYIAAGRTNNNFPSRISNYGHGWMGALI